MYAILYTQACTLLYESVVIARHSVAMIRANLRSVKSFDSQIVIQMESTNALQYVTIRHYTHMYNYIT